MAGNGYLIADCGFRDEDIIAKIMIRTSSRPFDFAQDRQLCRPENAFINKEIMVPPYLPPLNKLDS